MAERDSRAQDLLRTLVAEGWSQNEIADESSETPACCATC